jgi:hypothetical protein
MELVLEANWNDKGDGNWQPRRSTGYMDNLTSLLTAVIPPGNSTSEGSYPYWSKKQRSSQPHGTQPRFNLANTEMSFENLDIRQITKFLFWVGELPDIPQRDDCGHRRHGRWPRGSWEILTDQPTENNCSWGLRAGWALIL